MAETLPASPKVRRTVVLSDFGEGLEIMVWGLGFRFWGLAGCCGCLGGCRNGQNTDWTATGDRVRQAIMGLRITTE